MKSPPGVMNLNQMLQPLHSSLVYISVVELKLYEVMAHALLKLISVPLISDMDG
jgi:hypothetical protein